jgi:putative FmdB family regulatory protein
MPFYEYECESCKYYTEVMQKISDAPLVRCPSCGKRALKKLVSVPVFRLKGSGWYETDFKSDKEAKRNLLAAEKEEAKSEAKTPAATDAKPGATEAKETKEAKPAEAPPAGKSAAERTKSATTGSSRARSTGSRGASPRRSVRASAKRKARKQRR